MLDIGWTEFLVIGAIALLVVGPKDLPKVLRYVGYWMGKARSMAREFQRAIDQYAKEADLDDVKKMAETPYRAKSAIKNAIDPTGELAKEMRETEGTLRKGLQDAGTGPQVPSGGTAAAPQPTIPTAAGSSGAATAAGPVAAEEDKPKAKAG